MLSCGEEAVCSVQWRWWEHNHTLPGYLGTPPPPLTPPDLAVFLFQKINFKTFPIIGSINHNKKYFSLLDAESSKHHSISIGKYSQDRTERF